MKKPLTTTTAWERPRPVAEFVTMNAGEHYEAWQTLTARVIDAATATGWTKTEVARRAGVPDSTFSQWFAGKYPGTLANVNRTMAMWLDALDEARGMEAIIPSSPPFMMLRSAREAIDTLRYAQMATDMVIITYGAGMGKSEVCRHYAATRPHVYHATLNPNTKTVHGMLVELAAQLDVQEHNPAKLTRAIGRKLERIGNGTLLIIDEAQVMVDEAINTARHFMDIHRCGIALVGNEEVYGRFSKKTDGPSYAQIKRRIGKRLRLARPYKEDLLAFIAAWGVEESAAVEKLLGIGLKEGAFGQIDRTMKLAIMFAMGNGDAAVTVDHIDAAWKNRDMEDIA